MLGGVRLPLSQHQLTNLSSSLTRLMRTRDWQSTRRIASVSLSIGFGHLGSIQSEALVTLPVACPSRSYYTMLAWGLQVCCRHLLVKAPAAQAAGDRGKKEASMGAKIRGWRPLLAGVLALAAIAVSVAGCSRQPRQATQPFRITINTWVGFAPLYLAKEKGLFEQQGLKQVEIVRIDDAGARKASMKAGRIEGYASSVDNWALDSAHGVGGRIVMAFDESHGGDGIVARKSITRLSDLRGKTIGVQPGMPGQFLLFHLLSKAGLKPQDVKTVDMDSDKAGAAFVAGKLDAAVTWEPWLSKAASAGGHVLVSTRDNPGLIVDVLVAPEEVMKTRPGDVIAVMKAWFAALDYWKAHKDESDAIMAKALGLPKADFAAMCQGVRHFGLEDNRSYFGTSRNPGPIYSVFESAGRIWAGQKIIGTPTKAENAIYPRLLEQIR